MPLLLLIFGLLAIRNVRRLGRIALASVTSTNGETGVRGLRLTHSKDRQLIRILLTDVSIYLIFSLMLSVVLVYQQMTRNQTERLDEAWLQTFLVLVSVFISYIPSCIGSYNDLLISTTFRHEAIDFLTCK